ncbi:hypothetical protein CEXT_346261 [Caerostris extrusa]|uniref:Secreted protein n=1 Tax=Caerostris extrusa TaxID=172846 RepID=A0AAV4Q0T4_CAEEX|nr:hypothetical protein CEXT_346261 [Caerostris extrusa]
MFYLHAIIYSLSFYFFSYRENEIKKRRVFRQYLGFLNYVDFLQSNDQQMQCHYSHPRASVSGHPSIQCGHCCRPDPRCITSQAFTTPPRAVLSTTLLNGIRPTHCGAARNGKGPAADQHRD